MQLEEQNLGGITHNTKVFSTLIEYVDKCFKAITLIVSFVQYRLINSQYGKYCIKKIKLLTIEGTWLRALLWIQVAKVVIFTIWQYRINANNFVKRQSTIDLAKF